MLAVAEYAYRYWKRSGMTEWPTVRRASKSLGISQKDIEECQGNDYQLTGYSDDEPVGDWFVEAMIDDVERDWCKYWLPYSRRCVCGRHLQVIAVN